MRAIQHIVPLIIVILHIPVFSGIITGIDTVRNHKALEFSPHASFDISRNDSSARAGEVPTCIAASPLMDVFVAQEAVGVCIYFCPFLALGSPRPFYLSKMPFYSESFSTPLDLNDASRFVKYDTLKFDPHVLDSTHCYFPHISRFVSTDSGNFIVFKNIARQYVLARFNTIMTTGYYTDPMPQTYTYVSGYVIKWYLQTDGTANFNGINQVPTFRQNSMKHLEKPSLGKIDYFSIQGQRISPQNRSESVVIERNGSNIRKITKAPSPVNNRY
jgi:hypothetical protein